MKLGEIIQRIQSLYSKGAASDDSRLTSRHIYSKIKTVRTRLLLEESRKHRGLSQWNYQTLTGIPLELVTPTDDLPCLPPVGCYLLRSKQPIPKILYSNNQYLIQSVHTLDRCVQFYPMSPEKVQYQCGNKYTKNLSHYFIYNDYLYITHNKHLETVTMVAVLEDPLDFEAFENMCDCKSKMMGTSPGTVQITVPELTETVTPVTITETINVPKKVNVGFGISTDILLFLDCSGSFTSNELEQVEESIKDYWIDLKNSNPNYNGRYIILYNGDERFVGLFNVFLTNNLSGQVTTNPDNKWAGGFEIIEDINNPGTYIRKSIKIVTDYSIIDLSGKGRNVFYIAFIDESNPNYHGNLLSGSSVNCDTFSGDNFLNTYPTFYNDFRNFKIGYANLLDKNGKFSGFLYPIFKASYGIQQQQPSFWVFCNNIMRTGIYTLQEVLDKIPNPALVPPFIGYNIPDGHHWDDIMIAISTCNKYFNDSFDSNSEFYEDNLSKYNWKLYDSRQYANTQNPIPPIITSEQFENDIDSVFEFNEIFEIVIEQQTFTHTYPQHKYTETINEQPVTYDIEHWKCCGSKKKLIEQTIYQEIPQYKITNVEIPHTETITINDWAIENPDGSITVGPQTIEYTWIEIQQVVEEYFINMPITVYQEICDEPCLAHVETEFPLTGELVEPLIELSAQELIVLFGQGQDDRTNNSADDTMQPRHQYQQYQLSQQQEQ